MSVRDLLLVLRDALPQLVRGVLTEITGLSRRRVYRTVTGFETVYRALHVGESNVERQPPVA